MTEAMTLYSRQGAVELLGLSALNSWIWYSRKLKIEPIFVTHRGGRPWPLWTREQLEEARVKIAADRASSSFWQSKTHRNSRNMELTDA